MPIIKKETLNRENLLYEANDFYRLLSADFVKSRQYKLQESKNIFNIINTTLLLLIPFSIIALFIEKEEIFVFIKNNYYYSTALLFIKNTFFNSSESIYYTCLGLVTLFFSNLVIGNIYESTKQKKTLDLTKYNFCLIYECYHNINLFQRTKHEEYIETMMPLMNEYLQSFTVSIDLIEKDTGLRNYGDSLHQLNQVQSRFKWFQVTQNTLLIAEAFGKLPLLVKYSYINKKWNNVSIQLENILIYEYSKIKPTESIQQKEQLEKVGEIAIIEFGKKSSILTYELPTEIYFSEKIIKKVEPVWDKTILLFRHKNKIIRFVSWATLTLIISKLFKINLDIMANLILAIMSTLVSARQDLPSKIS